MFPIPYATSDAGVGVGHNHPTLEPDGDRPGGVAAVGHVGDREDLRRRLLLLAQDELPGAGGVVERLGAAGPRGPVLGPRRRLVVDGGLLRVVLGHPGTLPTRYNGGMPSYYDLLGVGPDADFEEVRRAYHRQAQLFHPDRYAGSPDPERRRVEEEMKAVNEAWATLGNPEARRRYDLALGLIDADGEDEELDGEGLWDDAERPRPSLLRRKGVRLAIVLVIIAGVVVSAVAALLPPDNNSTRWSATATAELRSAAVNAGMTAPQADCFVHAITTRYGPSDGVDRAVIQQVADACR
jgi:hypothetical protein